MNLPVYIYTLSCPISCQIKYVGKTTDMRFRYNQHISDWRKPTPCKSWIKSLKKAGRLPVMELIDTCNSEDWKFWETYWIGQMKSWGFNLKNLLIIGDGVGGHSEETKRKMSIARTGVRMAKETIAKLSKKVRQYDLCGNYIKTFDSLKEVERSCGFFTANIISAIKRKQSCGGFQWRYASGEDGNIGKYVRTKNTPHIASSARKVRVQEINKSGSVIGEHGSIREAEVELSLHNIGAVCRGRRPHTQNRFFKFAIDKETLNQ